MNVITNDAQCPITPGHIMCAGAHSFMGSIWQNMETEVSTYWLVKFAQRRGNWAPFTRTELEALYHESRPVGEKFWFNKLTRDGHIQQLDNEGEHYAFTTEFVAACYQVSPAC